MDSPVHGSREDLSLSQTRLTDSTSPTTPTDTSPGQMGAFSVTGVLTERVQHLSESSDNKTLLAADKSVFEYSVRDDTPGPSEQAAEHKEPAPETEKEEPVREKSQAAKRPESPPSFARKTVLELLREANTELGLRLRDALSAQIQSMQDFLSSFTPGEKFGTLTKRSRSTAGSLGNLYSVKTNSDEQPPHGLADPEVGPGQGRILRSNA